MMQFESVLLKGREFPRWNAVTAVPFLAELETHVLCGTHDVDCLMGPVELYQAEAREPFAGLRGDEVHTYPGDVTGRDAGGIIFSMIAGADERTCARAESRHGFYPVFGVPGQAPDALRSAQTRMAEYAALLAKDAQIARVYGEVRKSSGESVLPGKFQMQSVFTAAIQGQLLTNLASRNRRRVP